MLSFLILFVSIMRASNSATHCLVAFGNTCVHVSVLVCFFPRFFEDGVLSCVNLHISFVVFAILFLESSVFSLKLHVSCDF